MKRHLNHVGERPWLKSYKLLKERTPGRESPGIRASTATFRSSYLIAVAKVGMGTALVQISPSRLARVAEGLMDYG